MKRFGTITVIFVLLGLLVLALNAQAVSENRYLVKSKSGFWKNTFGARHVFENGFSANLSDWQITLAKVFGIEIESVQLLQILPVDVLNLTDSETKAPPSDKGPQKPKPSPTPDAGRIQPTDQTPWGIEYVYDDPAIASTAGGKDVKVAILDTGIYKDHPDLKNRVAQCKDFTYGRAPLKDGKCADDNGHGTHVSGIVAADGGADGLGIYGVAPEAMLLVYKVCDASGSCWADDIAVALRLAADEGANIVNLSLGSNIEVSMISEAIKYAQGKGVMVVAAAGNDGPFFDSIDHPAAHGYSVSVGAFNEEFQVPDWSSRGINSITTQYVKEARDVEFAAPGGRIESTWKDGGYSVLSGTSMSTPHISGLAAKLWQGMGENPAETTRKLLHDLARDIWDVGDDDATGFGFPTVPDVSIVVE